MKHTKVENELNLVKDENGVILNTNSSEISQAK